MKKLIPLYIMFILSIAFVSAENLLLNSGTSDEYKDGSDWNSAYETWNHPAWSSISILDSEWIWNGYHVTDSEAILGSEVTFRKQFELPKCLSDASGLITITADNEYLLRVNGYVVGTDNNWETTETYDLSSYLKSGTNTILIEAINAPVNGGTPEINPAGVIYRAEISYDAKKNCGNTNDDDGPITGGMDADCREFGYDYGVEKFNYEDGSYVLESDNPDYDITVEGNANSADWTADPAVDGVIAKGGLNYYDYDGGYEGTVSYTDLDNKGISHITFCAYEDEEVPEFGVIAGGLALIGALGVFMYRRN